MLGRHVSRSLFVIVSALVATAIAGVMLVAATPIAGCGPSGLIAESADFTPYEMQRTHPVRFPILREGTTRLALADLAAEFLVLDPLKLQPRSLQLMTASAGASADSGVYQYYMDRPIAPDMDIDGFFAEGGIQLSQLVKPADQGDLVEVVVATIGNRAAIVDIGDRPGALVYSDPIDKGIRTHALYWSDDTWNFSLIGVMEAEALVNLARSTVCGNTR